MDHECDRQMDGHFKMYIMTIVVVLAVAMFYCIQLMDWNVDLTDDSDVKSYKSGGQNDQHRSLLDSEQEDDSDASPLRHDSISLADRIR